MKLLYLPLIALLAACTPQDEPAAGNDLAADNEIAAEESSALPAPVLEGKWQIARYRNAPLPGSASMRVNATADQLVVASNCARMTWSYEQKGNVISFTPVSGLSGGCAADPTSFENGVADAVSQANIAMDLAGMLQLSGPGGVIDLEAL